MMKASIKISFYFTALLVLIVCPTTSKGVLDLKLQHVLSIYSDADNIGLKQPKGVACSDNLFLIVSDSGNGRLLRFTFQERKIGEKVVVIKVPQLPYPLKTGMVSAGDIFVLDGEQRRIVRLSPEGNFINYLDPKGLPGPTAYVPRSFHIDRNDDIYILDIQSERVLVLNTGGDYRRQIKLPEDHGFFSDVTVDFRGNVLLVDSVNATVYFADKGSMNFRPLTGNLKEYMRFPTNITTDSRGRIYLVDRNSGSIAILGQDGTFLGRRSGYGWKEGFLNYPSQMCINGKGFMFIADTNNDRVQIFETGE